jgi:GT2 family glycosyltransferase
MASTYENFQIVVADNASGDDSISFLKVNYSNIKLIINDKNEGFAKGYNTALKQVTADYYVLLNSDVEVSPGWIGPIISLMQADENIAACQPKILSYEHQNQFEYAGASVVVLLIHWVILLTGAAFLKPVKMMKANIIIQRRCFGQLAQQCL